MRWIHSVSYFQSFWTKITIASILVFLLIVMFSRPPSILRLKKTIKTTKSTEVHKLQSSNNISFSNSLLINLFGRTSISGNDLSHNIFNLTLFNTKNCKLKNKWCQIRWQLIQSKNKWKTMKRTFNLKTLIVKDSQFKVLSEDQT